MAKVAKNKPKAGALSNKEKELYFGKEPAITADFDTPEYEAQLAAYRNWANNWFDVDKFKDFFLTYAKNAGLDLSIKSLAAWRFNSIGKTAYLLNNELRVSDKVRARFNERIAELYAVKEKIEAADAAAVIPELEEDKVSAKDQNLMDYWFFYGEIDKLLTRSKVTSDEVTKVLQMKAPNEKVSKLLLDHYTDTLAGAEKDAKDVPVKGAKIAKFRGWVYQFVLDLKVVVAQLKGVTVNLDNTKAAERKPRKPRAKKEKPVTVLVSKVNYCKADKALGLTSIAPEAIIGSKALVVFNIHTRKFGVYYASTDKGLNVKGTSILDYDENKSTGKTLRKPKDQIAELTGSTLKRMEMQLRAIKAVDAKLKSRISGDVLLLKVYR